MGVFDSLKSFFGGKDQQLGLPKNPIITLNYSLLPMRLRAHSSERLVLTINIQYLGDKPSICSLTIFLQTGLSFDTTNLNKRKEIRLGQLENGEKKTQDVEIYSTVNTPPGDYKVQVKAHVHDTDYNKVVRSFEKSFEIRVV